MLQTRSFCGSATCLYVMLMIYINRQLLRRWRNLPAKRASSTTTSVQSSARAWSNTVPLGGTAFPPTIHTTAPVTWNCLAGMPQSSVVCNDFRSARSGLTNTAGKYFEVRYFLNVVIGSNHTLVNE